MDGFIGRREELAYLEGLYSQKGPKTCAVYGRRQIGKSTLLARFCEGKRHIAIQFSNLSEYENMSYLRSAISDFLGREMPDAESFSDIMRILAGICREEKTVLVFDEYPYALQSAPYLPSVIQRFIDRDLAGTESMVVICGSSMGMMLDETQRTDRPLYGRFMNRLMVEGIPLEESREFHENMDIGDFLRAHMTVGGVPKYHSMMDADTYAGCVDKCFIKRTAPLRDEAASIIRSELSPASVYSGIVACIGDGATRQMEIADKTGIDRAECSRRLGDLEGLGIVERLHPMLGAPKRPIYRIRDNLVAFHYEVLRKHAPMLDGAGGDGEKHRAMAHDIDTFLGKRFEDLCRGYIERTRLVKEIGKWWGRVWMEDTDIDIVAKIIDGNNRVYPLLCECKFTKDPMGVGVFHNLKKKAEALEADGAEYALFSLSGFESKLTDLAEKGYLELVDASALLAGRAE
jgi:AAA+ ATPase superfamily predicted ATPase